MLYDPKWGNKTKSDVLSIEGLIAWLEKQPAEINYDWHDCRGECLIGRYLVGVLGDHRGVLFSDVFHNLPFEAYGDVCCATPWTYGAALERARKIVG